MAKDARPAEQADAASDSDSAGSAAARLNEGQKECLRLVQLGYTAKEIAAQLPPLTFHAVEKRIKTAMALLGVSTRYEAARALAEHEGRYQPLVYPAPDLSEPANGAMLAPLLGFGRAGEGGAAELGVREEQMPFEAFVPARHREFRPPFPTKGRQWNDLTYAERAAWMIALTAGLALGAGTILNSLMALTQLVRTLPH